MAFWVDVHASQVLAAAAAPQRKRMRIIEDDGSYDKSMNAHRIKQDGTEQSTGESAVSVFLSIPPIHRDVFQSAAAMGIPRGPLDPGRAPASEECEGACRLPDSQLGKPAAVLCRYSKSLTMKHDKIANVASGMTTPRVSLGPLSLGETGAPHGKAIATHVSSRRPTVQFEGLPYSTIVFTPVRPMHHLLHVILQQTWMTFVFFYRI